MRYKLPDVKEQITTPCKLECNIDGAYCSGCGRHIDDIRMWLTYTEYKRKQIVKEISDER